MVMCTEAIQITRLSQEEEKAILTDNFHDLELLYPEIRLPNITYIFSCLSTLCRPVS